MGASRDASLLLITRTIRSFSDGFISILLASYLAGLGFSGTRIGAIATATLLGTALATLLVGAFTDRLGRRRVLSLAALLAFATGIAFAAGDSFWPLLFVAIVGTLNPSAVTSASSFLSNRRFCRKRSMTRPAPGCSPATTLRVRSLHPPGRCARPCRR